jgi:hypothetical protein
MVTCLQNILKIAIKYILSKFTFLCFFNKLICIVKCITKKTVKSYGPSELAEAVTVWKVSQTLYVLKYPQKNFLV